MAPGKVPYCTAPILSARLPSLSWMITCFIARVSKHLRAIGVNGKFRVIQENFVIIAKLISLFN
jgi:hypothetical protein